MRRIPDSLAREVEERSRKTGASLNHTVIEMLSESIGHQGRPPYDDLDYLAGTLEPEEAEELNRAIKSQRQVDVSLWT